MHNMLSAIVILSIAIYCITEQCIDEYNNINLFKLVIRVAPATVTRNIPESGVPGVIMDMHRTTATLQRLGATCLPNLL